MNFENEPQPHAPKRRDISLFEGIRTFAASVGTAALLMLSVCGLIGLPLPENAAAHAVSASHITAKTETVRTVQLGGDVFGIKLFSDGVIVAALSEIYADGGLKCPASEAGIQPGDYILSVNGNNVETNAALSAVLSENETNTLTLRRGTETFTAQVTSVLCEGSYKAGMWVRDSAAGIGTVTFYTEDGKAFGALGHGICDADTRNVLEIRSRLRHRARQQRSAGPPARVFYGRQEPWHADAEHAVWALRQTLRTARGRDRRGAAARKCAYRCRTDRRHDRR